MMDLIWSAKERKISRMTLNFLVKAIGKMDQNEVHVQGTGFWCWADQKFILDMVN